MLAAVFDVRPGKIASLNASYPHTVTFHSSREKVTQILEQLQVKFVNPGVKPEEVRLPSALRCLITMEVIFMKGAAALRSQVSFWSFIESKGAYQLVPGA